MTEKLVKAHDVKYRIEADPDSRIGGVIHANGAPYESPLLEHIFDLGLEGTAVDVGAHIGNHTLWFSEVCGFHVHAFEPIEYVKLQHNVMLNNAASRVEVHPVALGRGVTHAEPAGKGRLTIGKGTIPVYPLDYFQPENVKLIKIDVEDMEPFVLRGAVQVIERDKPIIFAEARDEWCHRNIGQVLSPMGYHMSDEFDPNRVATPVERWDYAD